jgi:flagellar motility protein MotE (MotC chaperone)
VLKIKDIIALVALAVVSFPVVLLGVLLWTGNVRLVFGTEAQDPAARARLLERPEDIPGATRTSTDTSRMGMTDSAMLLRAADLDRREAEAMQEGSRVQMLREDDARIRDTIRAERLRLEAILGKGDSLESARTTVLAGTFSGMKPDQAAKILTALDDILVTAILRKIPDDRPRAKILAAMGKQDVQRAARVSQLLSGSSRSIAIGPTQAPYAESARPKDAAADTSKDAKKGSATGTPTTPTAKTETKP